MVFLEKYMRLSSQCAAEAFLKNAPSNGTVQPNVAGTTSVKIDELLKPKELLLLSMTLEEADEWFRNF